MNIKKLLSSGERNEAFKGLGFKDGKKAAGVFIALEKGPFNDNLDEISSLALESASAEKAIINLERVAASISEKALSLFLEDKNNLKKLIVLCASSEALVNSLCRYEGFFEGLFSGGELARTKGLDEHKSELKEAVKDVSGKDEMMKALRVFRQREYIRIGLRDLLGLAPLLEVTGELSDLASAALDASLDYTEDVLKASYGELCLSADEDESAEPEITVIGMGKLGARELNFSSDIDIICFYSTELGETTGVDEKKGSVIVLHEYYKKLVTEVRSLMSDLTEDGFVFRVDLDLRPEGRSGELVNSIRSAEIYYEAWGQSWERSAMIKARPVAGSLELGKRFIDMITPFVYRRYLDFTAIDEIKVMKEKVDLALLKRNPDTIDVKLGAGGIREIEFFCQALELIHGGKNTALRDRGTLTTLTGLMEAGLVTKEEGGVLRSGYEFLRTVEHRLQIIEGRQTHALPRGAEEVERVARMLGFVDREGESAGALFWKEYELKTSAVYEVYCSLFYKGTEELGDDANKEARLLLSAELTQPEMEEKLALLGFIDKNAAIDHIKILTRAAESVRISSKARILLARLTPYMLTRAAGSADPDSALNFLAGLVTAVGAKTVFYALLAENLKVADMLVDVFSSSEFLSRTITEQPGAVDHLLSRDLLRPEKTREELITELAALMDESGGRETMDYEPWLDELRRFKRQELFRIGVNDILGNLDPQDVPRQMSLLAEVTLTEALREAFAFLTNRYGEVAGKSSFAILGLGKLGTEELTYGSDLDIVFVYDCEDKETTGERQITNSEFFVKLGQRIISSLTLATREGTVFSVDMRLRPSGSAGPLVVTKRSFLSYQKEKAEVWERQALLKARHVCGDADFGGKILAELKDIIFKSPVTAEELKVMDHIRERMITELSGETKSIFNLKTGRGGVVDIEFIVQFMQMRYAPDKVELRVSDIRVALPILEEEGLVATDDARLLSEAYGFYRALETKLRIVHDRPEGRIEEGAPAVTALARRMGYVEADAGESLITDYKGFAEKVRVIYLKVLEELGGI